MDRSGNHTRVVPVREAKDESWKDAIYQLCVDSLERGQLPNPEVNLMATGIYIILVLWIQSQIIKVA